jgi:hypothetical protein
LSDFILALLEDGFYSRRNTPLRFIFLFSARCETLRAKTEILRLGSLDFSFPNPGMARIKPRELHGKGDIFDFAAGLAVEVAVLLRDWIEALLSRVRIEAANDALGGHELQIPIHGSEADAGKPPPYPQVHLVGSGMIPAETEFLQNHGPLLRFSQNT